jgi:hypothetical protein
MPEEPIFLPEQEFYQFTAFDPESGLVGVSTGITPQSGGNVDLSSGLFFAASTAADTDYDGLPDDIELAIGTDPNRTDTNRDGIDDFNAIQQNIEPLGEALQIFPTN